LTHTHGDHAGSLEALHQQLPEAKVALSSRMIDFLQGDLEPKKGEPQVKVHGSFVRCTIQPLRQLFPGEKLGSLRVIASPGHSPDHIAFFDKRDGTLIADDAFQTLGGIAVSGVRRWRFPFPAWATWHKPTAWRSAVALMQLNPARLAVDHGPFLDNPQALMKGAVQEAEKQF